MLGTKKGNLEFRSFHHVTHVNSLEHTDVSGGLSHHIGTICVFHTAWLPRCLAQGSVW